jgi:hypothetical protein
MVIRCPSDLKKNVGLLERAVQTNQLRLIGRVLRNNTHIRKSIKPSQVADVVQLYTSPDSSSRGRLVKILGEVESDDLNTLCKPWMSPTATGVCAVATKSRVLCPLGFNCACRGVGSPAAARDGTG